MSSNKAALKQFLLNGHNLLQKRTVEAVLGTLNGNPLQLKVLETRSLLSSPSLLGAYVQNWLTRHQESVTAGTVKKILGLTDYKHPLWRFRLSQSTRKEQYSTVLAELKRQRERLSLLVKFDERHGAELKRVEENLRKVSLMINLMRDSVTGSLHPEGSNSNSDTSSNSNSNSMSSNISNSNTITSNSNTTTTLTQSSPPESPKLRGLLIRIAGPRKGNRAMTWERAVGAVSINSVDYVHAEEHKCQLPSKLGTFGLTLRVVYEKCVQRPLNGPLSNLKLFDGLKGYQPFI